MKSQKLSESEIIEEEIDSFLEKTNMIGISDFPQKEIGNINWSKYSLDYDITICGGYDDDDKSKIVYMKKKYSTKIEDMIPAKEPKNLLDKCTKHLQNQDILHIDFPKISEEVRNKYSFKQ